MPNYLQDEARAIKDAKQAYRVALALLQANCPHDIILKHTDSYYETHRVCEQCGLNESVQWDSPYKYENKALLKRAYEASWKEYVAALPKVD